MGKEILETKLKFRDKTLKRILWSIVAEAVVYYSRIPKTYKVFLISSVIFNGGLLVIERWIWLIPALLIELIASQILWKVLHMKI